MTATPTPARPGSAPTLVEDETRDDAQDGTGRPMDTPVTVPLWTVVMAIRYGLGRLTYANTDAANLARTFWPQLPTHLQRQIQDDARAIPASETRLPWRWITDTADVVDGPIRRRGDETPTNTPDSTDTGTQVTPP